MRDNWFTYHNSSIYHYVWQLFVKHEWFPDRFMNLNLVSPPLHWLSTHYAYQELCEKKHPDVDTFKCAMDYSLLKKHDDFDRVMDCDRSYFGHHDPDETIAPLWILRSTARKILYLGLFCSMLGIKIKKQYMIAFMCTVNVILMIPSLWMPFRRYGPDYTAYINQAG